MSKCNYWDFLNILFRGIPTLFLILFSSCSELLYDPVDSGDTPRSPATPWHKDVVETRRDIPPPFTEDALTADIPLSVLLDIALFNNPTTQASWHAARAAAYNLRKSYSEYYPRLTYTGTLNAQYSTIGLGAATSNLINQGNSISSTSLAVNTSGQSSAGSSISPESYTIFTELEMDYLLFDFGGREANVELARQALYQANWQHSYAMQQVMLSVLSAYTSWLGNKALVESDELDLKDAEVALKAAKTMHHAGINTYTDVLQAQSAVEQTKLNLAQARGAERTSFAQILIAIGLPADTKLNIKNLPDQLPVVKVNGDISTLLQIAKTRRPDLGAAITLVRQQIAQFDIAYSSGMPTFSLSGILSKLHYINNPILDGVNDSISLQANFPIFQGYFFINQERQIKAQIDQALANVDIQLAQIETQVVTNYYTFTSAVEALPASEALLKYSQSAFEGMLIQFKTGTSSITDVLTSLTTLSNARSQYVAVRTQWAASLANLAFSMGILEDTSGRWVDSPSTEMNKISSQENHELFKNLP